jgi:hypothetical protein
MSITVTVSESKEHQAHGPNPQTHVDDSHEYKGQEVGNDSHAYKDGNDPSD